MAVLSHPQHRTISSVGILTTLESLLSMDADTFCDHWFGLDSLSDEEREAAKTEWGHRAKRVRLLGAILRKPNKTVDNWGARFENMPDDYQPTLAYADALRMQLLAAPEELLRLFLEHREEQQQ